MFPALHQAHRWRCAFEEFKNIICIHINDATKYSLFDIPESTWVLSYFHYEEIKIICGERV